MSFNKSIMFVEKSSRTIEKGLALYYGRLYNMTDEELYDEYCVDNKAMDNADLDSKRKYKKRYLGSIMNRLKPKYKKGEYVLIKCDAHHLLYAVYKVHESGYSLISVRSGTILSSGIILPNIIPEARLIKAREGIDYSEA